MLVAKRAIRDHWSDWDEKFQGAPDFNVKAYQERLDEVCGTSRGVPIMKLEWGGNATITKYTQWSPTGQPTGAKIVPRFAIPRRHPVFDHLMYIPIRRWVICERLEPEQLRPEDNSDNTFTDENGVVCEAGDKTDLVHQYTPYIYVGDHSKCPPDCCSERLCLGDYKQPGESELNYLLECTYKLSKDFYCDPYSPLSEAQIAQIRRDSKVEQENRRNDVQNALDDQSREWWSAHSHRIIDGDSPKAQAHGKYHIFTEGKPVRSARNKQ